MTGGTLTRLGVVLVVAGALLMAGPVFGFSTFAADRGVTIDTTDDPDAILGIVDNTVTEELSVDGEDPETDAAAIYDLVDRTNAFQEADYTVDVIRIENEDGDRIQTDPPLSTDVSYVGDGGYEMSIYCSGEAGIQNDDYYVTIDVAADGDFSTEFERETNGQVEINCGGPVPDQPPYFTAEIDDDQTDSIVFEGETATTVTEVTNQGDEDGTTDVWLEIDGEEVDRVEDLIIEAGETAEVSLEWDASGADVGSYDAAVVTEDDEASHEISIEERGIFSELRVEADGNQNNIQGLELTYNPTEQVDLEVELIDDEEETIATYETEALEPDETTTTEFDIPANPDHVDINVTAFDPDKGAELESCTGQLEDGNDVVSISNGGFECE